MPSFNWFPVLKVVDAQEEVSGESALFCPGSNSDEPPLSLRLPRRSAGNNGDSYREIKKNPTHHKAYSSNTRTHSSCIIANLEKQLWSEGWHRLMTSEHFQRNLVGFGSFALENTSFSLQVLVHEAYQIQPWRESEHPGSKWAICTKTFDALINYIK